MQYAFWRYIQHFVVPCHTPALRQRTYDNGIRAASPHAAFAVLRFLSLIGLAVALVWTQIARSATTDTVIANSRILCVYAVGGPTGAPCANATAYQTIQHALDDATPGDQIRVANWSTDTVAGYEPFIVDTAVSITGGYTGGAGGFVQPTTPTRTIIDGIRAPARPAITIKGAITVSITHIIARGGVSNPSGTFVVPNEALLLQSGGTISGHFMLNSGASVDFVSPGTTVLAQGTRFDGAGIPRVRQLTGGNLAINGDLTLQTFQIDAGTVTVNGNLTVKDLHLDSATIGGRGNIAIQHAFTWTGDGSEMSGSGTTSILPDAVLIIDGDGLKTMNGRTLTNHGTIRWKNGSIRTGFGTTVVNETDGRIDITTPDNAIFDYYDAANRPPTPLTNRGMIRKMSAATTTFGLPLNNHGTVALQQGSIRLENGGTASGTFAVPAATTLEFGGGHYTLEASSSTTIAGILRFTSGTVTSNGSLVSTSEIAISGSTVTVSGSYRVSGRTTISSGKIAFNNPAGASSRQTMLQGGTLAGTGIFTSIATFQWTGGAMEGPGQTIIPRTTTMTLAGPEMMVLDGRIVDNAGTITWSGGPILSRNGAIINNRANATFRARPPDNTAYNDGGSGSVFNNAGRLEKTTRGVTTIGMTFHNTGVISITTGTLNLGGDVRNDGSITVQRGSTLGVSKVFAQNGGITTLDDATLTAGNRIDLLGGTLVGTGRLDADVRNSATLRVGALPGVLSISGEFVQTSTGTLTVQIAHASPAPSFDQLKVIGKTAVDGNLAVDWANGVVPVHGDAFPIITAPIIQGAFARVTGIPRYPDIPISVFYFRDHVSIIAPRQTFLPSVISISGAR